ncbi:MAG: AAA family ATPase [Flavobacteriia bacterium]|nr:AAA family ATPase [Flavobacteriia bacterium]
MKLNVKRDDITFGTNILDLRVPSKLRERHPCGVDYLDAAFGGEGFTPSTISLFTGEPGAGKTTLMLTLANALTSQGYVCLFNTAEESLYQVKLTCERLELTSGFIAGQESYVPRLINNCNALRKKYPKKPLFLIVDSLQTLNDGKYGEDHTNSQSAVRSLQILTDYAKEHYINVICIGQVNKSGNMAGSQKLKHMVDAMLHLSIEKKDEDFKGLRVLETVKNRFGGAGWTFFLDLKKEGFSEVARVGVK